MSNSTKDSSVFYRSFWEAIKQLPEQNQLEIYNAIFSLSFDGKEVDLTGVSKTIFTLIKPQILANNQKFENGKKGGRKKQKETKQEPNSNQNETKTIANVNVNANVNENGNVNVNENYINSIPVFDEVLVYAKEKEPSVCPNSLRLKYESWKENGWKDGNGRAIKNWKTKICNVLPYLQKIIEAKPIPKHTPYRP